MKGKAIKAKDENITKADLFFDWILTRLKALKMTLKGGEGKIIVDDKDVISLWVR